MSVQPDKCQSILTKQQLSCVFVVFLLLSSDYFDFNGNNKSTKGVCIMFTKKITLMHSTTVLWQEKPNRRILWFTLLMHQNNDGYIALTKEQLKTASYLNTPDFEDAINFLLGMVNPDETQYVIQKNRGYQINCSDAISRKKFCYNAPLWKQNTAEGYEEYLNNAEKAFKEITNDFEWLLKMKQDFPNIKIIKTIERAFNNFWGTRAGWENKKRRKTNVINWHTTLDKTIRCNAIFVQYNEVDNELEYFRSNAQKKRCE